MKEDRDVPTNYDRKFKRCKLETPVACLLDGRLAFETSVEISEGGLLLRIGRDYEIGQVVELRFFIPGSESFAASGEVAYFMDALADGPVPERHAGIRFLGLNARMSSYIRAYVQAQSAKE